uniref:Serine and arginine rich splicing factor 7a n=1 Tax=Astyanax mexicanus TaxID=7994 RepID=W5K1U8_ASTMX
MSYSSRSQADCKVYVGDLGNGAAKGELERAFSYYGPLRSVWVARNPPGFAFVEFEDSRDAEDAVKGMDGVLCGNRIRVEMSNGMTRKSRFGRPSRRQFDPNDRCYQCGETGHYAYDCYRYSGKRGGRRSSRSRSRSRGRRYSRSRSNERYRSPSYSRRKSSVSPARSRSRTPVRHSRSPVRRSRSPARRSRTPVRRSRSRSRSRSGSRQRARSASRSRSRSHSTRRDRSRSASPRASPTPDAD